MSGTDRQAKSARPNGTGGTSVPVLFSLRNVQPSIVAVGAKATESAKTASSVATVQTPPAKIASSTAAPTIPSEPVLSKPVAPQSKSGRSYNFVVGILVIAVCLLVIKNTQRNNSKTEIASNSDAHSSPNAPYTPVAKSPAVASTPFKPLESNPLVLGPAPVYVPQLPSTSNVQPKIEFADIVASNEPASSSVNTSSVSSSSVKESPTLQELNHNESQAVAGSNQTGASVPMLLSSSKPVASSNNVPSLPNTNVSNANGSNRVANTPNIAFPDARTAMAPESLRSAPASPAPSNPPVNVQPIELNYNSTNRSNEAPSQPLGTSQSTLGSTTAPSSSMSSAAESTPLVDTNRPVTTFREMQEVILRHEQNKLSSSANASTASQGNGPGIPASPVSNVGTSPSANGNAVYGNAAPSSIPNTVGNNMPNIAPNNIVNTLPNNMVNTLPINMVNENNTVLSGMPYPPLPKESQSPTVRPYEQGGLVNPSGQAVGGAAATGAPNSAQMIRQPATGGGNRYVPLSSQSPTAPMPYKPMTNTGYPPGNGN